MGDTSQPSSKPDTTARKTGIELKWPRQPYPGLRPFAVDDDVDESLVFFGRERQKDEILRRLNDSHVVFVVGPSGSGKSSLVKAGVIPALKAGLLTSAGHRWRIAQTRPERRPLAQLAEALAGLLIETDENATLSEHRAAVEDLLRQEDSVLWLVAESISERHAAQGHRRMRNLLLIDQFEEAFGPEIEDRAEVEQFFRILTRFFAKPHQDLYLIIAMRTGYIGSTAAHPDIAEMLNSTAYLTPILTPAQMAVAISRPAETYGGAVEPELVREILDDAARPREDMADQLPLVQHALFWMWERAWRDAGLDAPPRPGDNPPAAVPPLSLAQYRASDGLKGIMQRHAEQLYASAIQGGEAAEQLCELVFKRLCERDNERRYRRTPPTMQELQDLTGASTEALHAVLAPFIASSAGLLSVRPQAGRAEHVIDINHESLIRQWDRLRQWADEEAREVQTFRELVGNARQWEESGQDERHLRTGGQLELIDAFWKRTSPSAAWAKRYRTINRKRSLADDLPLVEAYVAASRKLEARTQEEKRLLRQREMRRNRWTVGVTVVLVLALLGGVASWAMRRDRMSNNFAHVGSLTARNSPIDALLIAEAAMENDLRMNARLEEFLQSVVSDFRLETELRGPEFKSVAFFPSGNDLLLGDNGGQMYAWTDGTLQASPVQITPEPDPNRKWFRWSPDGRFVFVGNDRSEGRSAVYKVVSGAGDASQSISLEEYFPVDDDTRRARFSKVGDVFRLVTFGRDKAKLWEWESDSGTPDQAIELGDAGWRSDVEFSQDGRRLAVEFRGQVDIYDVSKLGDGGADPEPVTFQTGNTSTWLAFHPDAPDVLVTGLGNGVLALHDLGGDKDLREIGKVGEIDTMVISPDGNWIATAGQDGDIWLSPVSDGADADASEAARVLPGSQEIEQLAFSSDSEKLASVSEDGVVRIWSVAPLWDRSTADFDHREWNEALDSLKPERIDAGEGVPLPLELDPTLKCLVTPGAPECS